MVTWLGCLGFEVCLLVFNATQFVVNEALLVVVWGLRLLVVCVVLVVVVS